MSDGEDKKKRREFDIIVVGSGAGLTGIAVPSARNGLRVCLVEEGPLGGTCLNRGCIPSKMLLHPAEVAQEMEECDKLHLRTHGVERHHQSLVEEVVNHIDKAAENWKPKIEEKGIHLIQDHVEFVDKRVIKVLSTGEEITAPKIFIACGARPAAPPIEGLDGTPYITYTEALRMTKAHCKPKTMCVIGGGYIGAELAFFFHEMGIKVTILDSKANLADREDEEVAEEFMKIFTSIIDVRPEVNITKVSHKDGKFKVEYGDDHKTDTIEVEQLLVATGVKANCDKLKVEKTGVELTDSGMIKADDCLRTTCEGVWALGDCVGNYMFRHSANFEAEYLLRNAALLKDPSKQQPIDYAPVPHAVFSYPQMSGVGKTEQELKEEGAQYIKGVALYKKTPMGMALRAEHGFAKVMVDRESRKILGFHVIGSDASKLVHEVIPVITMGGRMDDILKCIHIHPAMNEVVRDAFREARDAFIDQKLDIPDDIRYK